MLSGEQLTEDEIKEIKTTQLRKLTFEMNNTRLKCDNPDCDWEDGSVKFAEYKDWVEKPCPKCGVLVLSQEDYDQAVEARRKFEEFKQEAKDKYGIVAE